MVARCPVQHEVCEDYTVTFRLRGVGPTNNLELKLVDSIGQNVWRHVQGNLQPPARWKRFRIDSREFEFAWGPASGDVPKDLGAIELAIVAGEGGAGTLWVSDLRIEDHGPLTGARASASSALPGFDADQALGGSGWIPSPDDARPWIAVDFTEARRLGGLIIDWRDGAPASGFRVRASSRGQRWRTLYTTTRAGGARSYVYLPNLKTRLLRLEFNAPFSRRRLAPPVVRVLPFDRGLLVQHRPARAAGLVPALAASRANPVDADRDRKRHALRSHERGRRGRDWRRESFSIEPMVAIDGQLFTWADVVQRQELLEGVLPVPSAIWETAAWRLRVQGEATESGLVRLRYRLENRSDRSLSARLLVLVRPFQVTPPWQSVGRIGGVSLVHDLAWEAGALRVNETAAIVPASAPSAFRGDDVRRGFRRFASCHSRPRARGHASSRCVWFCFRRARLRSGARASRNGGAHFGMSRLRIPRSQSGSRHSIGRRSFPQRSGPAPGGRWTPSAPRSRRPRTYS